MALTKNVKRIDHVVIFVRPQNFQACVDKFTRVFELTFQGPIVLPASNIQSVVDWDAGIEIASPLKEEGPLWEKTKTGGDGQMTLVFGVDDIEKSKARAKALGIQPLRDITMNGSEPWFDRFSVLKETILEPIYGANIVLGEVDPKY